MLKSSKECITLIEIFKEMYKDLPDENIQEFADSLIAQITHLEDMLGLLGKELRIKESNTNKTIH